MADLSPQQLDALAQQRGFPNYAAWVGWHQKYGAGQAQAAAPAQQAPPMNFLQSLLTKIPSSFSLINHVSDAYGKATGQ